MNLSDFAGRKLLVYFYPAADTPGCTTQSCAVRDAREDLSSLGVDVVGIRPDVPEDQLKFDEKFGLGFPLLADTDHADRRGVRSVGQEDELRKDVIIGHHPVLVPDSTSTAHRARVVQGLAEGRRTKRRERRRRITMPTQPIRAAT